MNQFYAPDELRCRDSRDRQKSIIVTAVDCIEGRVKLYTGVVSPLKMTGRLSSRAGDGG
jgi:hypothetical protein